MNFQKMTKKQIDKHAETLGIKLDARKSKKDMIADLNKATKKKPVAKKAPVKKPVAKKAPTVTSMPSKNSTSKLSIWDKIRQYFNI